jgi:hypothetical protein
MPYTMIRGTLFAILVLSISILAVPGESAGPTKFAVVMVEIDQDMVEIDVGPDGNCTAYVTGKVYLPFPNNPFVDYADVTLEQDIPDYASLQLSAYKFRLSAAEPEGRFSGNFTVTPSLSSSTIGTVRISGTAVASPSGITTDVQGDEFSVGILPYYGAQLYFRQVYGKIEKGGSDTFVLQLNNTGNSDDTFTLSLADPQYLSAKGISVEFEKTHTVPEGGSVPVDVKVRLNGADRGSYVIKIEAVSSGKGDGRPEDSVGLLTLTVQEKVIFFLQGTPYGLIAVIVAALILVAAASAGISYALRRRRWKRQFQRMVDTTVEENRSLNPPLLQVPPPPP